MIKVEIPQNVEKLEQQIKALEYQIAKDTIEKDREIHEQAFKVLKGALMEIRIKQKIAYLEDMALKYNNLNDRTRGQFHWRENGINEQIIALEELLAGEIEGTFDECYEEDLKDTCL